jgi:conjugal transfer/entry exclusion protein
LLERNKYTLEDEVDHLTKQVHDLKSQSENRRQEILKSERTVKRLESWISEILDSATINYTNVKSNNAAERKGIVEIISTTLDCINKVSDKVNGYSEDVHLLRGKVDIVNHSLSTNEQLSREIKTLLQSNLILSRQTLQAQHRTP